MWSWAVVERDRKVGTFITLTDHEKMALAHVHAEGRLGLTIFELGNAQSRNADTRAALREAGQSIGRFGLVTDRYPKGRVRAAGKVVWLSDAGTARFNELHMSAARHDPCCEHMILLSCVCSYRSYCPNHGGGCHGSHD